MKRCGHACQAAANDGHVVRIFRIAIELKHQHTDLPASTFPQKWKFAQIAR
jgi:hypothetical protein